MGQINVSKQRNKGQTANLTNYKSVWLIISFSDMGQINVSKQRNKGQTALKETVWSASIVYHSACSFAHHCIAEPTLSILGWIKGAYMVAYFCHEIGR